MPLLARRRHELLCPGGFEARLHGAVGALCGALAQQLDSLRMVFDSARCFLLFASLFAIAVASNGSYKIMLYWGEDKFGWHGRMVTLMLASFAAATTLGCVLATRVLFARLGYATSAAALMVPSGVCLALLGLVRHRRLCQHSGGSGQQRWLPR